VGIREGRRGEGREDKEGGREGASYRVNSIIGSALFLIDWARTGLRRPGSQQPEDLDSTRFYSSRDRPTGRSDSRFVTRHDRV